MKINLVSDLHLEFAHQELPGGEVLILAGDTAECRNILRHHREYQTDPANIMAADRRCWTFFEEECAKYDRVFIVMGNHEHYGGRFDKTLHQLKAILPDNVFLLERETQEYGGVLFLGATLWTDLNRGDPMTAMHLKQCMNDYHVVQNYFEVGARYGRLTPEYTAAVHRKTVDYFRLVLEQNRDKKVVVITHHAPSFQSVHERYRHDTLMNGGYATDLSELILDHPQIQNWCHGHMHNHNDYMIGSTRVVSNPRGYVPHEDTGFDPAFTFEI